MLKSFYQSKHAVSRWKTFEAQHQDRSKNRSKTSVTTRQ